MAAVIAKILIFGKKTEKGVQKIAYVPLPVFNLLP